MKNSSGSTSTRTQSPLCRPLPGGSKDRMLTWPAGGNFAEAAIIHEWKETDLKVQLYAGGKCAVVTYFFLITFAMGTQRQTMKGRDMFFLVKEGKKWLVAADQFSPEPLPA